MNSLAGQAVVMHALAAFDKFRGTLSAHAAGNAAAAAALDAGWAAEVVALADGGEGTLEALGGPNRSSVVCGPLEQPVRAEWRLADGVAVIEMARASGLLLAGGADGNDPEHATTRGTGELIREAIESGASRIIVGVGGSATTDGGSGAVEAIGVVPPGVTLEVACDVTTHFVDAARVYGPQKGADPEQVEHLSQRLVDLAASYAASGADIRDLPGSGAAGGLAGGLAAIGAHLRSGFEVVAAEVGLDEHLERTDLVITGEGRLDATSWTGKVVGGVAAHARARGLRCVVVAGSASDMEAIPAGVEVATLVDRVGRETAFDDPAGAIRTVVGEILSRST